LTNDINYETPWQKIEWWKGIFPMELPLYCSVLTSVAEVVYTRLHRFKIKRMILLFSTFWNNVGLLILGRRPEHGSFIRASPLVLTQKGWYCFVTNKTLKVFWVIRNLLKHGNGKHLEYSIGALTCFECKMRRPSKCWQHFQCPCISS